MDLVPGLEGVDRAMHPNDRMHPNWWSAPLQTQIPLGLADLVRAIGKSVPTPEKQAEVGAGDPTVSVQVAAGSERR
jgi:hypothetical protein